MYRVDNVTASPTLPEPAAAGTPGYFTNGDPATGTPATIPGADWANVITEELCNAVTGAGLQLDKADRTQLFQAIQALVAQATGSSLAWGSIGGVLANQADLQAALDGKAGTGHTHAIANVNGLQTALDAKATLGANIFSGIQSAPGFGNPSDRRLKEEVVEHPAVNTSAWPKLYRWIWVNGTPQAGQSDSGVMADEVELLFPSCVHTGDDGYKRVDYGKLAVHLMLARRF